MKRNWEFIREILLKVEELPMNQELRASSFEERETAQYHMYLVYEAGLAKGIEVSHLGNKECFLTSLTWEGHELLDTIRNETVWKKTKEEIVSKGASVSLDMLKALAINAGMKLFGL